MTISASNPIAPILIAQPFGYAVARFSAGHVRFAGQVAQITFGVRGVWDTSEFKFKLALCFTRAGKNPRSSTVPSRAIAKESISEIDRGAAVTTRRNKRIIFISQPTSQRAAEFILVGGAVDNAVWSFLSSTFV